MDHYRMQISEDAYKYLRPDDGSPDPGGHWKNVRGVDGSMARVGRTDSAEVFDGWKSRLEQGKFEYVVPDE